MARQQAVLSWKTFLRRYSGHEALAEETVYALPERLIDAICAAAPKFLSPEEEKFERDLAKCPGSGFFLQQPFWYPPLAHHEPRSAQKSRSQQKHAQMASQLSALLDEAGKDIGHTDVSLELHHQREAELKQRTAERQRSYAGWLVTDPGFRRARDQFCEQWRETILSRQGMPSLPQYGFGVQLNDHEAPLTWPFAGNYQLFYRQWGLDSLATWDLPVPMEPTLAGVSLYDLEWLTDAGLVLFVPWYLLADKKLELHELVGHNRKSHDVRHLDGWLDRKDKLGHQSFALILELYVYLELALRRRYEKGLRRSTTQLEGAFAQLLYGPKRMEQARESVRKLRQRMDRWIKLAD